MACFWGHTNIVDMMIENAQNYDFDLMAKDKDGRNGFQLANYFRNYNVIHLIAKKMPFMTSYKELLTIFINYMETWTKETDDLVYLVHEIFQHDRPQNFEIAVNLLNLVVQFKYDFKSIQILLENQLEKSRESSI